MPTVTVSARHFIMPSLCVCCLGPPGGGTIRASAQRVHGKRVQRVEAHGLAFPACARCAEHHEVEPNGWNYAAWAIVSVGVLLPLLIPLYIYRSNRAQALRTPNCPRSGPAVTLEGWFGTDHRFWFAQPAAADAFLRGNLAAGKTAWLHGAGDSSPRGPVSTAVVVFALVALVLCGVCLVAAHGRNPTHNGDPFGSRPIPTGPPPTPEELRVNAPRVDAGSPPVDAGQSARHHRPLRRSP
jgi:hypothetical protein